MAHELRRPPKEDHLQRVQALTDAALAHLTVERLLDELLLRVRGLLDVDTAAVLLLDESGKELIATAAKGIEEEVEQGVRLPVGRGFAGTIAATGKPVALESVDHTKVLNPLLLRRGIRSMLGVPLLMSGRVIGVLHVGTLHPRKFTSTDTELLQLVADRLALALDARRHQQHQLIAETLQHSLLPERFPRVGGVEISGLYVPAGGGRVGGDWYDVFTLPSGSLCVVVGDTVGSGMTAAIAMARLRDAVRALAFVDLGPARAMTHLNDLVRHFDPGLMATAFIGVIDVEREMTFTSAGHMPPVYVDRSALARLIESEPEPALGAVSHTYREQNVTLAKGSTLILYTDGLVERRGWALEEGLEALRSGAELRWSSVEDLCTRVVGTEVLRGGLMDDLAVIVLRFPAATAGEVIQATITADPRELSRLRQLLRRWFAENGIHREDEADLLLAVGEAVANSVEHAYGPGRGSVRLHARLAGDAMEVKVTDQGRWRRPRGIDRGRGRVLMGAAMDEVTIESTGSGTTVHMRKVLRDRDD